METLHLKYHKPTTPHTNGFWFPADHESQRLALLHFSGGSCGIAFDRLDEIIFAAGMHGWQVTTEGHPAKPSPENACQHPTPSAP